MDLKTLCVHGDEKKYDQTGAVSMPIFQSATFAHPGIEQSTGFDYTRVQNPTREHLERIVARLEGGCDALAFSSGMAAIGVLLELFRPGDHIVASDDLYGGSVRYFSAISEKNGLTFDFVNTSDLEKVMACIRPETKAVFVETPTNPMMHVTDIQAVAGLLKGKDILLIVDNTFLTPYFQKPLSLGADVVVHSGTKYLGGHNDTLAGFLVVRDSVLSEKLRVIYKTVGSCLAPFDSWLISRGIKTLAVRMEKQQENALKIAKWLYDNKKVKTVYYVGLRSHPDYAVSVGQASGFGAMISFEMENEDLARQALENVKLIQYAESLGGVESLITYPILQTHADVPRSQREAMGINGRLLRLSVGLEDAGDLISDLQNALGD
ncbi:MAG TPA: PLP-dependent aspartate aminotransferase family protein [Bacillota bacterium]|nr:PLP-dependent aspartate aminotransferase family protein [Bacillota bacterium]